MAAELDPWQRKAVAPAGRPASSLLPRRRARAAAAEALLLVAPLLLLLLAAGAAAADTSSVVQEAEVVYVGEHVLIFKDGTPDIRAAADSVINAAASQLASTKAAAAGASAAALAAAAAGPEAAAVLSRPATTVYATPKPFDRSGRPVPQPVGLVRLHSRVVRALKAGGPAGAAAAQLEGRILKLIKQHPAVVAVEPHEGVKLEENCGPSWSTKAKCAANGDTPCCSARTVTCDAADTDACGADCMADWGACNYVFPRTRLGRENVLNPGFWSTKLPNYGLIEAVTTDPTSGKLKTPFLNFDVNAVDLQVMVLDSGVGPHYNINLGGCKNYHPNYQGPHDGITECQDEEGGHGTHVAGIIGARNSGSKTWGVLPGVQIFSAKAAVGADPDLSLVAIGEALNDIIQTENEARVAVINMSLGKPSWCNNNNGQRACGYIDQIRARWGVVVVGAAGNRGDYMGQYRFPNCCTGVITATAAQNCTTTTVRNAAGNYVTRNCAPAWFSNFIWDDAPTTGAAGWAGWQGRVRARTYMAPGYNIYSTLPNDRHGIKSGTSMAAPHISGMAARCFASGDCQFGDGDADRDWGTANLGKIQAAFAARNADPKYAWSADGSWRYPAKESDTETIVQGYFGPMAWAGHW